MNAVVQYRSPTMIEAQTTALAKTLTIAGDAAELVAVLKATAFKGPVSDAQMTALLVVANQYGLNPWTKEIYAFPDKNNGIVPVVGVDGWSRIINTHAQMDGMDFEQDAESCTCIIYRKDRSHPIRVTEWMSECKRPNVGPWQSHPKRMLRHKALIQCARLAFGFVGIYDQDEAERIVDADYSVVSNQRPGPQAVQRTIPEDTPERLALIEELKAVAKSGTEVFRSAWEKIGKEKRKLVPDRVDEFRQIAAAADADIAAAEQAEVAE